MQHSSSHSLRTDGEQVFGDDIQSGRVVLDRTEFWVTVQHGVEHIEEKLEGVLVQEVHLVHVVEHKVNSGTCLRHRHVLLRNLVNFLNHNVCLFNLEP